MVPTLLFLPGTLCDARVWHETRQALREWPCAVVDYRFETSISAMAAAALDEATGSIIPIGLSMGGIVALDMWRQAAGRIAAMALFDTDPGADTPERRLKRDAHLNTATRGDFRAMIESQLAPTYFSQAHSSDQTLRASDKSLTSVVVEMALDQGAAAFAAQANALATRTDAWPLFEGINVPTLIACGAEDRICPPQTHVRMAAQLPMGMATFRTIAGAGHLSPLEQPEAVTRVLRTWLNHVVSSSGVGHHATAQTVASAMASVKK